MYMIDVMCDAGVGRFYERLGFLRVSGAVRRNYGWRTAGGRWEPHRSSAPKSGDCDGGGKRRTVRRELPGATRPLVSSG